LELGHWVGSDRERRCRLLLLMGLEADLRMRRKSPGAKSSGLL
jgi:hypothetical protein